MLDTGWMDTEDVCIYTYTHIVEYYKPWERKTFCFCASMVGPWDHNTKWGKLDKEKQI